VTFNDLDHLALLADVRDHEYACRTSAAPVARLAG